MTDLQALQWVLLPPTVLAVGIALGGIVQHRFERRQLQAALSAVAAVPPHEAPFPGDAVFRAAWRAVQAPELPPERARTVRRPPSVLPVEDRPERTPPVRRCPPADGAELPDWAGAVAA